MPDTTKGPTPEEPWTEAPDYDARLPKLAHAVPTANAAVLRPQPFDMEIVQ